VTLLASATVAGFPSRNPATVLSGARLKVAMTQLGGVKVAMTPLGRVNVAFSLRKSYSGGQAPLAAR
jgi:hypothetical protein